MEEGANHDSEVLELVKTKLKFWRNYPGLTPYEKGIIHDVQDDLMEIETKLEETQRDRHK